MTKSCRACGRQYRPRTKDKDCPDCRTYPHHRVYPRQCPECGTHFVSRRSNSRFCNQQCAARHAITHVVAQMPCWYCGAEFPLTRVQLDRGVRYCSVLCRTAAASNRSAAHHRPGRPAHPPRR